MVVPVKMTLCLLALAAISLAAPLSAGTYFAPGYYSNNPVSNAATANAKVTNQSVIIGTPNPGDRLLLQETAYASGTWLMISSADIVYPKKGQPNFPLISCIKVLDQQLDGKNGQVKVKGGGLGRNNVLLRFHSQRGEGLHYLVQIYGK